MLLAARLALAFGPNQTVTGPSSPFTPGCYRSTLTPRAAIPDGPALLTLTLTRVLGTSKSHQHSYNLIGYAEQPWLKEALGRFGTPAGL
jgi:hypothetical protein